MKDLDMEKVHERVGHLFGKVEGAMTCAMGYVGDRLGLYRALAEKGPTSSHELASAAELDERWVREWLYQQAAAGIIEHDDGRFSLTPESSQILAQEDSPLFGAGVFGSVIGLLETVEGLEDSFRTGIGSPYDSFGPKPAIGTERLFAPFFRNRLIPEVLPALEGVVPKLRDGAKVADVGCGTGIAAIEMARAFPKSTFHAFDNSRIALGRATGNRSQAGVKNMELHDTTHQRLEEDQSYDLITTFDCIHDMTHPTETIGAIKRSLKPDGTWFVADIRGGESFADNMKNQPFSGMLYGFSVICCMRAALSTPDGEGLGTLGFHHSLARRMAEEAGFKRFKRHDFDNPLNDYYEIRP